MKKVLAKGLALAFAGSLLVAGNAMALPTLVAGYDWNTSDYWTIISTDSDLLQLTFASSSDFDFGVYSVDDIVNPTAKDQEALIFSNDSVLTSATLTFEFDGLEWDLEVDKAGVVDTYDGFGTTFGFFAAMPSGGDRWYTDIQFNSDGYEHLLTSYDASQGNAFIYGEMTGGSDAFDELTVSATDVAPVPEPATMLLFGSGLAGLAGYRRKKAVKK